MKKFLFVTIFFLTTLSLADEKKAPSQDELTAITNRGKALAEYDLAAWHGSDALIAIEPDFSKIEGYLAKKESDGWHVVFGKLSEKDQAYLIAYEALPQKSSDKFKIQTYENPKKDKDFYYHASSSIFICQKDFIQNDKPNRTYNVAVIPKDDKSLWVYFVPAPIKPGTFPLGQDIRYLTNYNGDKILEKRRMHNSILEREFPKNAEMGIHSAIIDDVPEDSDVFHVLQRIPKIPEIVMTKKFVYTINIDGQIYYMGTVEEVLKKEKKN